MRYFQLSLLFALACTGIAFASFTHLYTLNGSILSDPNNYYAFSSPSGLLFANGTLYVADNSKNAIYLFNGTNRTKALIGSSTATVLSNPLGMEYSSGTLYIADGTEGKVKTYSGQGSSISNWNIDTVLSGPSGLAIDGNNIYIADANRKKLYAYSRQLKAYSFVAVESGGSDGLLSQPIDVEIYGGKFYISDAAKSQIYVYDSNFSFIGSIGAGKGGVVLKAPHGVDIYNDRLYVADTNAARVVVFSLDGYPLEILNASTPEGNISYPLDVAVSDGKLYVADTYNHLVKAFEINETLGDAAVLAMIESAQSSLASLKNVSSVAARLNITTQPSAGLETDLASAYDYYNKSVFSSAASLADKVDSNATSERLSLEQAIGFKLKQLLKSSQERVAPYRQYATGSLTAAIVQFDNTISVANARLASKDYSAAADSSLWASARSEELVAEIAGKAAQQEAEKKSQAETELALKLSLLSSKLDKVDASAVKYRQAANTSNSHALLLQASTKIAEGDFGQANRSLELASLEIDAYDSELSKIGAEIDAALAEIRAHDIELNATMNSGAIFKPDYGTEKTMISQSYSAVYSNPQLAVNMARQSKDAALVKSRDSQTISLAVTSTLAIIGLFCLLVAGFYLYARKDKKSEQN